MMCGKLTSLDSTFDLDELVLKTPGYVGADLSALIDEALVAALNRYEFILNSMISIVICLI
jgi:SpoVK/Ycf46/Vps4 family AAA+-type ATPase